MKRFIALHPTEEAAELLKRHPNAFLLLTQIAMRARWEPCRIKKLAVGESLIGDWREAGLQSEMTYRHAKKTLEKFGLAKFRGTTTGTIAKLADSTIFSTSADPSNGRATDGFSISDQNSGENTKTATTAATTISEGVNLSNQTTCDDIFHGNNEQNNRQGTGKQRTSNGRTTTNHSEYSEHSDTDFLLQPETEPPPPPKATRARHVSQDAIRWTRETKWSGITEQDRSDWKAAFPACDIDRQLARMHAWLVANPAKAKKSKWRKFIVGWLSGSQDKGGDIGSNKPRANGCL